MFVELRTVVAVAEDRTYRPDPIKTGAVPVGSERSERLSEVVGCSITVVAVSGGEVSEHDTALLRARFAESIECADEVVGRRCLVADSKGGISGEGVQAAGVVEVEPRGCGCVGVDRGRRKVDLVSTRGAVACPAFGW